jgi:hypothetical protein
VKSDHSLSAPSPRYASALADDVGLGAVAPSSSYCTLSIPCPTEPALVPGFRSVAVAQHPVQA